jgi:hypothetical protein
MMPDKVTYHVVGVRSDGSRKLLAQGASRDEAKRIRDAVAASNAFTLVHIERDDYEVDDGSRPDIPMIPG